MCPPGTLAPCRLAVRVQRSARRLVYDRAGQCSPGHEEAGGIDLHFSQLDGLFQLCHFALRGVTDAYFTDNDPHLPVGLSAKPQVATDDGSLGDEPSAVLTVEAVKGVQNRLPAGSKRGRHLMFLS